MRALSAPTDIAQANRAPEPRRGAGTDNIDAVVLDIWDRVLERGPEARAASLLDLKAGVLRVHRLFSEIGDATGVRLPITAMFQAPTAAQIAALVRLGKLPPTEPLAELKQGAGTPLFIFPGIGGVALELVEIARLIDYEGPVYANQPLGLDGQAQPHQSIAEMAAYQCAAVRRLQPHGPYRLAGYSFGGLVALEVARLLLKAGEPVDFLGLIEPPLPERQWPAAARMEFLWRRFKHHAKTLRALSPTQMAGYLASHADTVFGRLRRLLGASGVGPSPYHREGLPAGMAETRAAANAAFQAYELTPYPGKAILIFSKEGDELGADTRKAFQKYLSDYEERWCGGDHATMLRQPHVKTLATFISDDLARLSPTKRSSHRPT